MKSTRQMLMSPITSMRLSVVVVNWNSRQDLDACLRSVAAQTHADLETVVVDNGSDDESAAMVRDRFPQVILIEAGQNLGFAEGCNRGIRASSGEWIALLNNDAVADPGWAAALCRAAVAVPPRCGMLQSAMLFLDRPDTINSTGLRLLSSGGAIDRQEGDPSPSLRGGAIFCPTGGACAYRRAMLDAIALPTGYFDADYFMYCEDFDLGWRAQLAGWTAETVTDAVVRHRFHGSTQRRGRAWFVVMTRTNRLRTLIKNASPAFLLRTAPYTIVELAELFWHGGAAAAAALPNAIRESMKRRRDVDALVVVDRQSVEKQWVESR